MTKLYEWEDLDGSLERRQAVPGGWIYSHWPDDNRVFTYVPDPTAPHCQPAPPADDRPPMTDEALEAWLTATYGEPARANET